MPDQPMSRREEIARDLATMIVNAAELSRGSVLSGGPILTKARELLDSMDLVPPDAILALPTPEDEGVIGEMREALEAIVAPVGVEPENAAELAIWWRNIAIAYRQRAKRALSRAHQAEPGDGDQALSARQTGQGREGGE